ncbi:MAG: PilZ domain-containing protein [Candidatus Omnitrophota bacterium]
MLEERRKFLRVNVKYQINVKCSGQVIKGDPQCYTFHAYTENISEGGMKIILEKEIKVGSLVELQLFITDKEALPIQCNGVIIWNKKANPEGTKPDLFHTGIQYTDLVNPVYLKFLREVISCYLDKEAEKNS